MLGFQSQPEDEMRASRETRAAIEALVDETDRRMSTPDSDPAALMSHPDFAVAGSGLGELAYDQEDIRGMADAVSSWGFTWSVEQITVWQEGDVAWAQILGSVRTARNGVEDLVPYWTTGVFGRDADGWRWRYWGGAEPQENPRV
jgi:hypothetical protein